MKFEIKTLVSSRTSWEHKRYGVVLVDKAEHIDTVYQYLVNLDSYWESYKNLIRVAPTTIESEVDLEKLTDYAGKTDIDNVSKFISDMADKGIDVFVWHFKGNQY